MPIELLIESGPLVGKRWSFSEESRVVCGADFFSNIQLLDDEYVSNRHFELEYQEPGWYLRDLNSSNGTYVNSIRYGAAHKKPLPNTVQSSTGQKSVQLQSGDTIQSGQTLILVRITKTSVSAHPLGAMGNVADYHVNVSADREREVRNYREGNASVLNILKFLDNEGANASDGSINNFSSAPKIPGYEVLGILGSGGMGTVYKAVDTSSGVDVAIKTMRPEFTPSEVAVRRFQREIQVLSTVIHKHVVNITAHGKLGRSFYIVMELAADGNLYKFSKTSGDRISLTIAGQLMLDMLDGLDYLHGTGHVHRDLKPENILISREPRLTAKLADFGLSKAFEAAGLKNTLTQTGQTMGSAMFWAKEHVTQYKYLRPVTDLFEMAAVFYWMLTGDCIRPAFLSVTNELAKRSITPNLAHYAQVVLENDVTYSERFEELPPALKKILKKALTELHIATTFGELEEDWARRTEAFLKSARSYCQKLWTSEIEKCGVSLVIESR